MSRISTALARVLAVLALAAVALALFLIISSATEDSDSGDSNKPKVQRQGNGNGGRGNGDGKGGQNNGPPKFYVVQPGDSLSTISEETGVSLEKLQQLNPDIDPQLLPSGVKLQLR